MAKMTSAELEEIIKQSLPGYRIARGSQVAGEAPDAVDAEALGSGGVDAGHVEELRRKYLGTDVPDDDDDDDLADESLTGGYANGPAAAFSDEDSDNDDDEMIVAIEPESSSDPLDRGARAKAVVISKKEKKLIGQQG